MLEENAFRELIRGVRAGDGLAAAELVRSYEQTVRCVARVRLVDERLRRRFDSLDICQSVFASFFVRAALGEFELDRPEQLLGLLVSMSQRKLIDHARQEAAARRDYRRQEPQGLEGQDFVAAGPTPGSAVEADELLTEFRKRLTNEELRLAEGRAQGHDWNQIAARQGGSPEALRKQLGRAIDRVGRELGLDGFSSL